MFDIRIIGGPEFDENGPWWPGAIVLGSFREEFRAEAHTWGPDEYLSQWRAAASHLLNGGHAAAFLTSYGGPAGAYHFTWPAWREGCRVYFQQRLLLADHMDDAFTPEHVHRYVGPRMTVNDDGDVLSEWLLEVRDLAGFLDQPPSTTVPA